MAVHPPLQRYGHQSLCSAGHRPGRQENQTSLLSWWQSRPYNKVRKEQYLAQFRRRERSRHSEWKEKGRRKPDLLLERSRWPQQNPQNLGVHHAAVHLEPPPESHRLETELRMCQAWFHSQHTQNTTQLGSKTCEGLDFMFSKTLLCNRKSFPNPWTKSF